MIWHVLGWSLVLAVSTGSLVPGTVVTGAPFSDKIVHAFSYFVLMVWFAGLYTKQKHLLIALTLLVLGVVLEFVQARLPYRFFDPLDLLANFAGILAGLTDRRQALVGKGIRHQGGFDHKAVSSLTNEL